MPSGDSGPYLSTMQAAEALGVSTVKRWVDEGILPAHKTAGGHRKLLRAEVLALVRQADLPHRDLAVLILAPQRHEAVNIEVAKAALQEALLGGQGAEVSAILRRAYNSGLAVETIADRIVAPAKAGVGLQGRSAEHRRAILISWRRCSPNSSCLTPAGKQSIWGPIPRLQAWRKLSAYFDPGCFGSRSRICKMRPISSARTPTSIARQNSEV